MLKVSEQNEKFLLSLTDAAFTIEKHINAYELRSIEIGDLDRAIKYNWLRNAYLQGQVTDDEAFLKILEIHTEVQGGVHVK